MSNLDEIERAIALLKSAEDLASDHVRAAVEQAILGSIAPMPQLAQAKVIPPSEATKAWQNHIKQADTEAETEKLTNLAVGQMYRRDAQTPPVKPLPQRDRPKIGHEYSSVILEYVNELGKSGLTSTDLQDIVEPQYRHRVSDSLHYLYKRGKIRRVLQANSTDSKGAQRDLWCYYPLTS